MKHTAFIDQLDHRVIEAAIVRAEQLTSGEIRVFISPKSAPEPVAAARKIFAKLGMTRTKHRNAVLIFVAPSSQTFAVIGDEGVHAKCGDAFWTEVAAAMNGHFHAGQFTLGIVHGVERAGALLAGHFPRRPDDTNELPDRVAAKHPVI
jgi:uncharacterized membrane protein